MPASLKDEVEALLAGMLAEVSTLHQLQDTIEIVALARQRVLPAIGPGAPPSFIPAMARATVLSAFVQRDALRALKHLAA